MSDGFRCVCDDCWNSIERIDRRHPLYLETCSKLLASNVVDDLVSCFVFEKEGAFQHIAHAMKYEGVQSLGLALGEKLGGVLVEWGKKADFIVPIPLHRKKLRLRGFNQAELIARGVSRVLGIPVRADIVHRRRETVTQTELKLEERKKNVEGAFEAVKNFVGQLNESACIVVDDVITTGATLQECAGELRGRGVRKIIAASAALAQ